VLAGLLAFFLLEKLVLWRHARPPPPRRRCGETEHAHALHAHGGADQERSGLMIPIGTSVHNFCDGIVIAAAFLADRKLGSRRPSRSSLTRSAAGRRLRGAHPFGFARARVRLQRDRRRGDARRRNTGWYALAATQQIRPTVSHRRGEPALRRGGRPDPELHRRPEPADRAPARADRARSAIALRTCCSKRP
jgi:hypothetical protein